MTSPYRQQSPLADRYIDAKGHIRCGSCSRKAGKDVHHPPERFKEGLRERIDTNLKNGKNCLILCKKCEKTRPEAAGCCRCKTRSRTARASCRELYIYSFYAA